MSVQSQRIADSGHFQPSVAVIDDDASVADAIAAVIDSQGWQSRVYLRGEDFLADLDADDPPDCVLIDLYMPDISGVDVLWRLADLEAAIPAIVLTAKPEGPLSEQAMLAGALEVISKPVRPERLLQRIKEAVGET
jgi:FixJ family two-component response regulator